MKKEKYIIVISEDAMIYEDVEVLKGLPFFSSVWDRVSMVKRVRSVYPTVTYPNHTSMRTGCYCGKHGITGNAQPLLGVPNAPWLFFNDAVQVPDIFDAAKKAGLSTAAVFWPVTGNHPNIDYLVDEYWPQTPEETSIECYAASGSSPEVVEKVIRPNVHLVDHKHRQHPQADQFVFACACSMIREFKPNLLMIHPANLDTYRHHTGVFSDKVTHGLHECDLWFGDILKACEDAGILEDTDFFILSDHGQVNITRIIAVNALLAERGLLQVAEEDTAEHKKGDLIDFTAYAKSVGACCQVYLKDPDNAEDYQKVYTVLKSMADDGIYGFERVYTAEEAQREEGLSGGFQFVLESDGYTSFSEYWTRPFVKPFDLSDYRFGHGTHGYHPDKGPQPTLIAFGPDIKPGVMLERRPIVDEAPTYAAILGIDLPDADGKAIQEILK